MVNLVIGSLGGTIAMVGGKQGEGVTPSLPAETLLASIPGFRHDGRIDAETVLQLPSASLTMTDVLKVLDWCRAQVAAGAGGIVLTQGTDTLEEVSFLLDLFWTSDIPLVVTGAMRHPASVGADGPANLQATLQVAAAPESRGRGVLVVMNDVIHAARWVSKADALAVQAFVSTDGGIQGRITENKPAYFHPRGERTPLPGPVRSDHKVGLIFCTLGSDTALIEHAATSDYAGLVIAAFGAGHVSAADADVIGKYASHLPVIVGSRTGGGRTAAATYGFPGSEMDLVKRGAWLAGWLSPVKARILLWAIVASGLNKIDWRTQFDMRTGA
jgi:L-asparaginase